MANSFYQNNLKILQVLNMEPLRKAPLVFDAETHPDQKPYVEVWRMQNESGMGPYSRGDWMDTPHGVGPDEQHPMPQNDNFDRQDVTELHVMRHPFGFESMDHLNMWFSPVEQKRLAAHGFKPTRVKAKKVWSSGRQAFYEPYQEKDQEKLAASEKPMHDAATGNVNDRNTPSNHVEAPQRVAHWSDGYMQSMKHDPNAWPKEYDLLESVKQKMIGHGRLVYDPSKGFIRNSKISNRGNRSEPLMRSEQGALKLIHYSHIPSLKTIDPNFHSTGYPDRQIKYSGKTDVPVSYYYRENMGPENEEWYVKHPAKSKYVVSLKPEHKLYDLAVDHQNLVDSALKENDGIWNTEKILGKIKGSGFHGYFNSKSSLPGVVAIFHPHSVDREDIA